MSRPGWGRDAGTALAGWHVFASCLLVWTITAEPAEPAPVRIMPLGDSITESNRAEQSYRYYLWKMAAAAGYRLDFVGSLRGVYEGLPADTSFDLDHEGHSGWRADQVLARVREWSEAAKPDVVLLHLGHNDLCQRKSVPQVVEDLSRIIGELRAVNAGVRVLLAQIIASAAPCHAAIGELNARLPSLAAAENRAESPVVLVDLFTGFSPSTMTIEGVHPNASGEAWMAERWFAGLRTLLEAPSSELK